MSDSVSRFVDVALPSALGFSVFIVGIAVCDFGTRRRIMSLASRFLP
jgi:hypothetical protein